MSQLTTVPFLPEMYIHLSEVEKDLHDLYKNNDDEFAYKLNDSLVFNKNSTQYLNEINTLDKIIEEYSLKTSLILYRATSYENITTNIKNSVYSNTSYLSTSLDLRVAQKNISDISEYLLIIFDCQLGTKMVYMETNPLIDSSEKEVLLGRNQSFRITSDEIITDTNNIKKYAGNYPYRTLHKLRVMHLATII